MLMIYANGPLSMSVCTDLEPEVLTTAINEQHPAGTENGWVIADEPFASGETNPCPCERFPENLKHYLIVC